MNLALLVLLTLTAAPTWRDADYKAPDQVLALTTIRVFLDRHLRIAGPRVIYGPSEQAELSVIRWTQTV